MAAALSLAAPPAARSAQAPASWTRAINLSSYWWDHYAAAAAPGVLDALRTRTGTTQIVLVPTWYMSSLRSSAVSPSPGDDVLCSSGSAGPRQCKTPSDASLIAVACAARAAGMTVAIKPHVDVYPAAPGGDAPSRSSIAPRDVGAWFASYNAMLRHYARLAIQVGARTLVVGTELSSLSVYAPQWQRLIRALRRVTAARDACAPLAAVPDRPFAGRLTFAALWSAVGRVRFWHALDLIGIDAYYPVARASTSVGRIERAWAAYYPALAALARRERKKIVFTEIGYPWRADGRHPGASPAAQARFVAAAYAFWASRRPRWFDGFAWWTVAARPPANMLGSDAYELLSGAQARICAADPRCSSGR